MFRALAVISASAWLALAPAALAATHKSSHAKHGGAATPSMKAKLRHAAEDEEPPALHKVSASHVKSGKHRRGQELEAPEEAPAHASRRHGKASDEETASSKSHARSKSKHHKADDDTAADTAETKSRRHGHAAAEEADEAPSKSHARSKSKHHKGADEDEADVSETKTSSKHHRHGADEEADEPKSRSKHRASEEADEETDRSSRHRKHAEEVADSEPVHGSLRSTRACVAAHVRAHGRPHGSRARAALQRECVKEVEAARRKAEEEAMIRNWSAPRGPLIYPGALPHGTAPAPSAVSEPPPTAEASAVPSTTAPVDPAAPAPEGAAKGEATVQQQPAPSAQTSFLGSLWSRVRRGPQRAPGSPAPTLAGLVGSDEARLKAELGEPELMRAEGDGALWTYRLPGCALYVFLGRDSAASAWKVKGAQSGPLNRGGTAPDVDVCLKGGRS